MPSPSAVPGFEPTQHYQRQTRVALTPGSRVGEFEIVRVLGVGGFSIVYLARDLALNRLVALKEYLPSALAVRGEGLQVELRTASGAVTFEQGLDSFLKEARMLARFDHPSLVRVHHFWRANGTAYMAMRYLEGVTLLAARRAMLRPPDEAWLRSLIGSLLGAVEALHAASCFHRDISPDNILLLPDGTPVLLDFGAARSIVGDGPHELTAILKPGFAPIEQYAEATDLRQGPWTDLYALGAVVRNCITARPPIPSTVRAVGDRLPSLALEVRGLATTFPGLSYSPGFLAAIDWALALRPNDRPQSVAQFRQALALDAAVPIDRVAQRAAAATEPAAAAGRAGSWGAAFTWARDAAGMLSSLRPGAAGEAGLAPAAPVAGASSFQARPSAPDREPTQHTEAPAQGFPGEPGTDGRHDPAAGNGFWPPSRDRLRRAMPWSVAAVLLGAAASVGWRSFEEHRVGRDMAMMASSAAAAAEWVVAPAAFPAAPALADDAAVIYTTQPLPGEPADARPDGAPLDEHEPPVDPDADLITELRDGAEGPGPRAPPLPTVELLDTAKAGTPGSPPPREDTRRVSTAGGAGSGATAPRKTSDARTDSPRRVCARQTYYTDYACMQRQCKLSRFRGHAQCESLRKTGWWGFVRFP